ncbi:hypothetical protein ABT095_14580 [Kitasatospora sp. NPDC002227]|uniref:hypothetical protein n=1 Tax=Kitasatospora sp. NPDC002227 TaxID=3154773 RepID=UPI00331B8338
MNLSAPPTFDPGHATNLGGFGLGAFTAAGAAATITALIFFLVRSKKLRSKIDSKMKWEFFSILAFLSASLYDAAGWNIFAGVIHAVFGGLIVKWGAGAVSAIVTGWLCLWDHKRLGAIVGGYTVAILWGISGSWLAIVPTSITHLVQSWNLGS